MINDNRNVNNTNNNIIINEKVNGKKKETRDNKGQQLWLYLFFFYKKLGCAPGIKSFLISHENFSFLALKVSSFVSYLLDACRFLPLPHICFLTIAREMVLFELKI